MLFDITSSMLRHLARHVRNARPRPGQALPQLTIELLQELLCAALTVPFSQTQKLHIVRLIEEEGHGILVESVGYQSLGLWTVHWPFDILDKKPGVSMEVLEASLITKGCCPCDPSDYYSVLYPTPARH